MSSPKGLPPPGPQPNSRCTRYAIPRARRTLPKKPWRNRGRRRTTGRRPAGRARPPAGRRELPKPGRTPRPKLRPPRRAWVAASARDCLAAPAEAATAGPSGSSVATRSSAVSIAVRSTSARYPIAAAAIPRRSHHAPGDLRADPALHGGDRPERVLEVAARERAQRVGADVVVGR